MIDGVMDHENQVVELPATARNVEFYADRRKLPESYRHALQDVR
jgi:hypothetical protein